MTGKGAVLVVDDEPDIVEFLTTVLQDEGYTTDVACNGVEALERVGLQQPSLIILDLMMPRMSGFDFLIAMRDLDLEPRPAVIVLSAKSSYHDILRSLEQGADDFIPKPFDLEDLLLRVRVWLDRIRPPQTNRSSVQIYTLGPFRVIVDNTIVMDEDTGDPRSRTLIKYLVTEWDQPVQRSQLLYMLWPDLDEPEATKRLKQLIPIVDELVGTSSDSTRIVQCEGNMIRIDPHAGAWVDAQEFESQIELAQNAQENGETDVALGLYLSGLALYKEDYLRENLYEDWPSDRREKLREMWISTMFRVAAICADRCEFSDSVRLLKKVLEIDPYRENAYQALMLYLARAGRRGEAIQLYRYAERLFAQHLAAQPAPSTRVLYEKILRGEAN